MQTLDTAAKVSVILIAVVIFFAALDVMQDFVSPVILAVISVVILSPASDRLDSLGLPKIITAFLSFLTGISALVVLFLLFQPAAERAVNAFPKLYSELNSSLYSIQRELRGLREVEESVKEMVDPGAGEAKSADEPAEESPADAIPSVEDVVLLAPAIFAQMLVFLGTFFFFLLTKREIYQAASKRLAAPDKRIEFTLLLLSAERRVARYFLTISTINLCLGVAVGAAYAAIGMPSPILWGIAAFLLNFLIYLGPAALSAALLVVGITVFDGAMSVVPLGVYLTLNTIESQFLTPVFLGKSLSVNPLAIFLTVTFFLWLWGPVGAIVAIPLLLWGTALAGMVKGEGA
ncbi:MAG: AI-2E family transporter [Silicimonas sp.]|nr:AI-2E family transporter [Silicimonas sp.]